MFATKFFKRVQVAASAVLSACSRTAYTYGIPVKLLNRYIQKIKRTGKNMVIISEGERYVTRVKERRPEYRLVFQQ